jgi:hypothetical protein
MGKWSASFSQRREGATSYSSFRDGGMVNLLLPRGRKREGEIKTSYPSLRGWGMVKLLLPKGREKGISYSSLRG